jgi:carbonic anhydrase
MRCPACQIEIVNNSRYITVTDLCDGGPGGLGFSWRAEASVSDLQRLIDNNRRWARRMAEEDPAFFSRLVTLQAPEFLWIGCSDSRVPANQITGLMPGEVFVHRNVANLVVHTDMNCLAVLQYAVEVLGVRRIIVCGHYGCGGVRAACEDRQLGLIDNWLRHIKDVFTLHRLELERIADPAARADRLCELNVIAQVKNVCHTTIVQNAWARQQPLSVHGLVYSVSDGLLRDLAVRIDGAAQLERIHRMDGR